jgi:hypothetical protein
VTTNLPTPAKVNKVVTAMSTINLDGTYVFPSIVEIDGLTLTPSKTGFYLRKVNVSSISYTILGTLLSGKLFEAR